MKSSRSSIAHCVLVMSHKENIGTRCGKTIGTCVFPAIWFVALRAYFCQHESRHRRSRHSVGQRRLQHVIFVTIVRTKSLSRCRAAYLHALIPSFTALWDSSDINAFSPAFRVINDIECHVVPFRYNAAVTVPCVNKNIVASSVGPVYQVGL